MNRAKEWFGNNLYSIKKVSFSLLVVVIAVGLTTTFAIHYFSNSSQNQEISEQYPPMEVYDVYGNPVEYDVVAPPENEDEASSVVVAPTQDKAEVQIEQEKDELSIDDLGNQKVASPGEEADLEEVLAIPAVEPAPVEDVEPAVIPPLARPCDGMVTKSFGLAYSGAYEDYRHHAGVDLLITDKPEIYAAAEGIVCDVFKEADGRWTVTLEHDGYTTHYEHLTHVNVAVNDVVSQNQQIGKVAPKEGDEIDGAEHIHFEVKNKGQGVDPTQHMDGKIE